ncbi:DUF6516 family protein [Bacillus pseudomycoides]|jgi:hypothetical protein|uniref:DUF6516 family protein n=1 Tax=Bacillus pseudomycoides TaxID=64104 RepID=UPI000BEDD113|nr:DUF6516 family protein [Bacillus pseudomycoides]PEE04995.1 hypothetical protein CON86_17160 [Bacillus pseudomycoides]PEM78521.1 hypothetical protein CN632_07120 [Bacillus pseudomycoides]PHC85242.1 hypothetical protein COF63_14180 [Bacillus pseudomycoides]
MAKKENKIKTLNIPAIDYSRIEKEFADIILQVVPISRSFIRLVHHIKFKNIYYLECEEVIVPISGKPPEIGKYYFNLFDENGQALIKFHSERHEDKRYQTPSEPFHIHKPPSIEFSTMDCMANFHHHDLYSIMEFHHAKTPTKHDETSNRRI